MGFDFGDIVSDIVEEVIDFGEDVVDFFKDEILDPLSEYILDPIIENVFYPIAHELMRPIEKFILDPLDIEELGPIIESVLSNAMFSWVSGGLSLSTNPYLSFVGKGLQYSQNPLGSVMALEPFASVNEVVMDQFDFITDPVTNINTMIGSEVAEFFGLDSQSFEQSIGVWDDWGAQGRSWADHNIDLIPEITSPYQAYQLISDPESYLINHAVGEVVDLSFFAIDHTIFADAIARNANQWMQALTIDIPEDLSPPPTGSMVPVQDAVGDLAVTLDQIAFQTLMDRLAYETMLETTVSQPGSTAEEWIEDGSTWSMEGVELQWLDDESAESLFLDGNEFGWGGDDTEYDVAKANQGSLGVVLDLSDSWLNGASGSGLNDLISADGTVGRIDVRMSDITLGTGTFFLPSETGNGQAGSLTIQVNGYGGYEEYTIDEGKMNFDFASVNVPSENTVSTAEELSLSAGNDDVSVWNSVVSSVTDFGSSAWDFVFPDAGAAEKEQTDADDGIFASYQRPVGISREYVSEHLGYPTEGQYRVNEGVSYSRPRDGKPHNGLDIGVQKNTGVKAKAAAYGDVAFMGSVPGYGNTIILYHADLNLYSLYGHLASFSVQHGDSVMLGDQIGIVGDTGGNYDIHLHFELLPANNEDILDWRNKSGHIDNTFPLDSDNHSR
ncbi:MAG: M23 family metallopeptidase [Nitrospirae bacterium]|nr:M23 family metallopeptidase [Magnetococcales bacterium]